MRLCTQCGLSIGETSTFCPVCGAIADPVEAAPATTPTPAPVTPSATTPTPAPAPAAEAPRDALTDADLESEARGCEKTDPARAAALYRQAIVEYLDSDDDPLGGPSARRDVQRLFDRLSLVLKREGLIDEALEEIDSAAYLGLVDDEQCGTKAQRDALVKRRDALRRAVAKVERAKR
jgi:hypothetical protein